MFHYQLEFHLPRFPWIRVVYHHAPRASDNHPLPEVHRFLELLGMVKTNHATRIPALEKEDALRMFLEDNNLGHHFAAFRVRLADHTSGPLAHSSPRHHRSIPSFVLLCSSATQLRATL